MKFYWFILGVLSVWRVTHLLHAEDGPWDLVVWLRRRLGQGFCGKLLDCFYCLSFWVALPIGVLIGTRWRERILLWLALSAGAILLERATSRELGVPAVQYFEDKEGIDVLLRPEKATVQQKHSGSSDS
jgi:hypothetical protein